SLYSPPVSVDLPLCSYQNRRQCGPVCVRTRKEVAMRRRNRQRGFTLIELLIVVTIILIIAAFTIPKITKAKIPANETSAVASIRAINEAEMIYSSSHPDVGFTP